MRTAILACFTVLSLAACSPEPAKQETPPPASTAAPAPFHVQLTNPAQVSVPNGSPIAIAAGEQGLVLRNFVANASAQLKTDGASVALGSRNEVAFAGHRVRVTIRARGLNGAQQFFAAYSTHGNGNSGWRRLPLSDQAQDASFIFDVPPLVRSEDDFVGINPPSTGAIEVQSISVDIVDELRP